MLLVYFFFGSVGLVVGLFIGIVVVIFSWHVWLRRRLMRWWLLCCWCFVLWFNLTRAFFSLDYFSVSLLTYLNLPLTCSLVCSIVSSVGFFCFVVDFFIGFFAGYFVGFFAVDIFCCGFTWRGRFLFSLVLRLLCYWCCSRCCLVFCYRRWPIIVVTLLTTILSAWAGMVW